MEQIPATTAAFDDSITNGNPLNITMKDASGNVLVAFKATRSGDVSDYMNYSVDSNNIQGDGTIQPTSVTVLNYNTVQIEVNNTRIVLRENSDKYTIESTGIDEVQSVTVNGQKFTK